MSDHAIAAHTFDFKRVYVSTRDLAAPGSGTWTNPVTIFDGSQNLDPVVDSSLQNLSAGAQTSGEDYGIFGQVQNSSDASHLLAYIGNGLPANPVHLTFPGSFALLPPDYWEIHGGFYTQGAAKFGLTYVWSTGPTRFDYQIFKTTDELTFTNPDSANSPLNKGADVSSGGAVQRVGKYIYCAVFTSISDATLAIYPFNMQTGLWEASFAPLTATINRFGLFRQNFTNDLYAWPNGDFSILYQNGSNLLVYRLWTAGAWGSEIVVNGHASQATDASIIDPDLTKIHVFVTDSDDSVNEYTITQSGTVVLAGNIPPPGHDADGVGHPSVQNGILFVPRDDNDDFDNAVWVRSLPAGTFQKELLPIPPGETNAISTFSIANPGSGYVNGDTGTINGGVAGYLAIYVVVGGLAVINLSYVGGGYTAGTTKATTTGGAQPGVGTGLTVNILTVRGKTPSCAYMMYPNGYDLSPTVPTLLFDVKGTAESKPQGPPTPVLNPTECVNQS